MAELTTGFRVPRWFLERAVRHYDLSAVDRLVFMGVCSGMKRGGEPCRLSYPEIADRCGLERESVRTSVVYLVRIGLLIRTEVAVGRRPAAYTVPEHMPWPEMVLGPGRRATHDGSGWKAAGES